MTQRHFWKKNPNQKPNFFSINDAGLLPENHFLKNSLDFFQKWRWVIPRVLDFFSKISI